MCDQLSAEEYNKIIHEWNKTENQYPNNKTIIKLFEEQVEKSPENIASVYKNQQLTYKELNEKSNQIAYSIRTNYKKIWTLSKGRVPIIGIYMESSLNRIVALYGILKAGAAYVTFDSSDPVKRLEYKIKDCGCKLLLTSTGEVDQLNLFTDSDVSFLTIDDYNFEEIDSVNPDYNLQPDDLAYIIYTSGSTGMPKGAMNRHHSFVNLITWYKECFDLNSDDKVLICSSYSFDLTQKNFFAPLISGATLYLPDDSYFNPVNIAKKIRDYGITRFNCAPSAFYSIMECYNNLDIKLSNLRYVFLGGESIDLNMLKKLNTYKYIDKIVNTYGPSECTDVTHYHVLHKGENGVIPIGNSVQNIKSYILNEAKKAVKVGEKGSLHIGGVAVGLGYLNNENLTNEKFICNPFQTDEEKVKGVNSVIYNTGDICKWRSDGEIEFVGRADDQVKIRGFRVELGEIENKLSLLNKIVQCAVICKEKEGGEKYLVAYYVQNKGIQEDLLADNIREYLGELLPDYMVPGFYIKLDSMPLNTNGKIDRNKLAEMMLSFNTGVYLLPETETEKRLCDVWQNILNIKEIGRNDNFFALGGHSISLSKVAAEVNLFYKTDIDIRYFFEYPVLSDLAQYIEEVIEKQKLIEISEEAAIERIDFEDNKYPLSSSQKRIWFLHQYYGGNTAYYNVAIALRLKGKLDIYQLEKSVNLLVQRHEGLRTVFKQNSFGEPYQKILSYNNIPEVKLCKETTQKEDLKRKLNDFLLYNFDIENELLIKVNLFELSDDIHILAVNHHHIISDGISLELFLNELAEVYNSFGKDKELNLAHGNIRYVDFAVWDQKNSDECKLKAEKKYWLKKLENYEELVFPLDKTRPAVQTQNGDFVKFDISNDIIEKLNKISEQNSSTLYMILLTGFYILLYVYSNQKDLLIGTAVDNRNDRRLENVIGFFINTIILRVQIGDLSVSEFIKHVRQTCLEAFEHKNTGFEALVDELNIEPDQSKNPLFQILFNYFVEEFEPAFHNLEVERLDIDLSISKFDLTLYIFKNRKKYYGIFNYNTDLFNKDTIERLKENYLRVLNVIVNEPTQKVENISLLERSEYDQLIDLWNRTETAFPVDKSIVDLFAEQVRRNSDLIAVEHNGIEITLKELDLLSDCVAREICKCNTLHRDNSENIKIATVFLPRSSNMVAGILAVLKAGYAYVCLDVSSPVKRSELIVKHSESKIVITESAFEETLKNLCPDSKLKFIYIDEIRKQNSAEKEAYSCDAILSKDPAYLIYTSGTTNIPKGVVGSHRSAINRFNWMWEKFPFKPGEVCAMNTIAGFVRSVWEIFVPLLKGVKLVTISHEDVLDPVKFTDIILEYNITRIVVTPSLLRLLLDVWKNSKNRKLPLVYVFSSGEPLPVDLAVDFIKNVKEVELINLYGSSENACDVTSYRVDNSIINHNRVPVGRLIYNTKAYILNDKLVPVPIGVEGNLFISGVCLADGYLKNLSLTETVFIKNPFNSSEDYKRMYKTGDRAYFQEDGNIVLTGRTDNQIKIRGFRIEPAEVEAVISKFESIKQCVVLTYYNQFLKTAQLVAYYTSFSSFEVSDLRKYLDVYLPNYMIPAYFREIGKFPLLENGKLNKKALPAIDINETEGVYIAPSSDMEKDIVEIWSQILGIDKIGITDNYFHIGGDSLNATKTAFYIADKLNVECPVKAIFDNRTVGELACYLEEQDSGVEGEI